MRRGILGLVCLLALVAGLTGTAQAAKYDDDTVIVKFAGDVSSAQRAALFDTAGVNRTVGSVTGVGAQVVRVQGDPAVVARRLNRSALVSYAEPNFILRATADPERPAVPRALRAQQHRADRRQQRRRHRRSRGLGRRRARRLPRERRHRRSASSTRASTRPTPS